MARYDQDVLYVLLTPWMTWIDEKEKEHFYECSSWSLLLAAATKIGNKQAVRASTSVIGGCCTWMQGT